MPQHNLVIEYPRLFQEVTWPWGPTKVKFELLENAPPDHLIANVNIVAQVGDLWLIVRLLDGSWEIPGGTLEPGESYLDTVRRELLEEAGAHLKSFRLIGAWHCFALAGEPYRPHLPFPEFYRVVGSGEVDIIQLPDNPSDGEQVSSVECVSLQTATERFGSSGRHDLAELYHLVSTIDARSSKRLF